MDFTERTQSVKILMLYLYVYSYSPEVKYKASKQGEPFCGCQHIFSATPVFNQWGHVKVALVI